MTSNSKILTAFLCLAVGLNQSGQALGREKWSAGTWSVGNCISAKLKMVLETAFDNNEDLPTQITIPPWATAINRYAGGIDRCIFGDNTQVLELSWENSLEFSKKGWDMDIPFGKEYVILRGNLIIQFHLIEGGKSSHNSTEEYGINRITGTFDIKREFTTRYKMVNGIEKAEQIMVPIKEEEKRTHRLKIDSGILFGDSMLYITPIDDSLPPTNDGEIKVLSTLYTNITDKESTKIKHLNETVLHFFEPKILAFKDWKAIGGLSVGSIVGISVGCIFFVALLIGGVAIAHWMIKKRNSRYEEMLS